MAVSTKKKTNSTFNHFSISWKKIWQREEFAELATSYITYIFNKVLEDNRKLTGKVTICFRKAFVGFLLEILSKMLARKNELLRSPATRLIKASRYSFILEK